MFFNCVVSRRLTAAAIWGSLAVGGAYLYLFEPGKTGVFPICPFRALTGFNCPGCGTTRGLHQLLHGHLVAAFEFNPFAILFLPVLGYVLVSYTKSVITGRAMPPASIAPKYAWLLVLVVLSFWIIRNTPLYPFPS